MSDAAEVGGDWTRIEGIEVQGNSSIALNMSRSFDQKELSLGEVLREECSEWLKWVALVVACSVTVGSYYIYDFPGSIGTGPENTIQRRFVDDGQTYSQGMNLALYSIYSWPNSVLAIFGGILIDKYLGLRKSLLLFCGLVVVGSCIFWLGVLMIRYPLIVIGRFVYGLGAESLTVAQSAFIARWFAAPKRGLSFAFALGVCFSRVGSSFNFLFSPMISVNIGVTTACFVGFCMCVASFAACMGLVLLDKKGQERGLVLEEAKEHAPPFSLAQLKRLPPMMWIISLITLFAYCAIFPFTSIAENFFEVRYGLPHDTAGQSISLFQGMSAGLLPIAGLMVDTVGRHCYFLMFALSGLCSIHVMWLSLKIPPAGMMAMFAAFYSVMVASLWTTVPFTVADTTTGFAYGVMTALQNFGLAVFPLVIGAILDSYTPTTPPGGNQTNISSSMSSSTSDGITTPVPDEGKTAMLPTLEGYRLALLVLLGSAIASLCLGIMLFVCDKRRSGVLSASPKARKTIKGVNEQEALLDTDDKTSSINEDGGGSTEMRSQNGSFGYQAAE